MSITNPPLSSPKNLSKLARVCLETLAEQGLGEAFILGGAFGLSYYFEYRITKDIDAWWTADSVAEHRQAVIDCIQGVLQEHGQVRTRVWGQVNSIELTPAQATAVQFSFQIAPSASHLSQCLAVPWPQGLWVESFADLLAGKMVALIERGAPRDFRDIYMICWNGLARERECWAVWEARQKLNKGSPDHARARLALQTHLARLNSQRPLELIADPASQAAAAQLRSWFHKELLDALD